VVGGGNSALEEAGVAQPLCIKVTLVHVLDEFQAQPWAVDEARSNPKLEASHLHAGSTLRRRVIARACLGARRQTGQTRAVEAEGCFIFIGYEPSTSFVAGLVERNGRGEIVTDDEMRTSVPGVFAAGDARTKKFRQITTAVADGTIRCARGNRLLARARPSPGRSAGPGAPKRARFAPGRAMHETA